MKRQTGDTLNMLCAAGFVLLVLLLTFWFYAAHTRSEETEPASDSPSDQSQPAITEVSYPFEEPARGPFRLPSAAFPLDEAEQARIKREVVSLSSYMVEEEPSLAASPGLFIQPEVLLPLSRLAEEFRAVYPYARLEVISAFTPGATAPAATGYALTLAVAVGGGLAPLSSGTPEGAWLLARRAEFGFVSSPTAASEGEFLYVGCPHARLMENRGLSPGAYIAYLRLCPKERPLAFSQNGVSYSLFYLPATPDGTATLSLPEGTPFSVTPDGASGFLIALKSDDL